MRENAKIFFWGMEGSKTKAIHIFDRVLGGKESCVKQGIQIDFYLIDSFEIFHFMPFYEIFANNGINAMFIVEPCSCNTAGKWFDYQSAITILEELDAAYASEPNLLCDYVFTTQDAHILNKYKKKTKKVNLSYGFSFEMNYYMHSERTTKGFDIRLVHGAYSKRLLSKYMKPSRIFVIGYPKHRGFFEARHQRTEILKELGIHTDKKIICYFPTWDEESSIPLYRDVFKLLAEKYYIVTKPHHCTARLEEKKDDRDALNEFSDLVLGGNYDFGKAALIGDIAICDAKSGSTTEIPYLNPQIKLLILFNRKYTGEKYFPDILDFGECVFNPEKLEESLEAVCGEDKHMANRRKYMQDIYGGKQYGEKDILEIFKGDKS